MYQINVSALNCENGESETYGVTIGNRKIYDLSPDREKVENFIDVLNRLEVSPIHLDDVIDDFLCE